MGTITTLLLQMFEEQRRCTVIAMSVHTIPSQFSCKCPRCKILENFNPTFQAEFSVKGTKIRNNEAQKYSNCWNTTLHLKLSVAVFSLTLNGKSYEQCNHCFERLFCSLMDLIVRKWVLIISQNQAFQKQVLFAHFPPSIFMANVDISFMGFFFKTLNW